jgi:hypothetical protein
VGSRTIWVNTNSNVTHMLQIFVHEFTHFSLLNIFWNGCYPYINSRDDEDTSAEQKKEMVQNNNIVAPENPGWKTITAKIPDEPYDTKEMIVVNPNLKIGIGILTSFGKYEGELLRLLETIPHMIEIVFILTVVDLNYETIFHTVDTFYDALDFFVSKLLYELRRRDKKAT